MTTVEDSRSVRIWHMLLLTGLSMVCYVSLYLGQSGPYETYVIKAPVYKFCCARPDTNIKKENDTTLLSLSIQHENQSKIPIKMNNQGTGQPLLYNSRGRLGNQLFQFSTAYCTALKANRTPIVYSNSPLLKIFPNISAKRWKSSDKFKYFGRAKLIPVSEINPNTFNPDLLGKVNRSKNTLITGYFQSWKYFNDCEDNIRRELQFDMILHKKVDLYMRDVSKDLEKRSNISHTNVTFIGIHIRRTDRTGHAVPISFIHRAMEFYSNKVKYPLYFIASDDIEWCEKNINSTGGNVHFASHKDRTHADDFVMLASCKHLVISVGTFGWFAAWLSGGETVYYGNWLQNEKVVEDHFLSHWIQMV